MVSNAFDKSKKISMVYFPWSISFVILLTINNYSPKAKWLPVNIHQYEVEVNIHRNHWA
jgi:hypothetical protein